MRRLFVGLLLLVVLAACAKGRSALQSKLKSLRHGMTKAQVQNLLGKPSAIQGEADSRWSTWLAGIAEVWEYWTDEQGKVLQRRGGEQQGSAYFDDAGKLRYAWAGYEQVVAPVSYPMDKPLVAHFQATLLETYWLKASRGELAKSVSRDAVWFSTLPTAYVYPDYTNAPYRIGIEVKTALGNRVSYGAEMSRDPDPWKRTWTFAFNAALDPQGNLINNQNNF
ncbi:MAG: hypothetical protein C5B50_22645 [Verrucomicrobia bacterium]|nr:MAG: hypothetical protein C5B50_22645 [Verrucomicrobiota bacterium]